MQELEICVSGATEGSLPQVMVTKGGSQTEAPPDNVVVILFLLTNFLTERKQNWRQTNIQPI